MKSKNVTITEYGCATYATPIFIDKLNKFIRAQKAAGVVMMWKRWPTLIQWTHSVTGAKRSKVTCRLECHDPEKS